MEFVQPIRNKKQLEAMKKMLKASNMRDYCMFVMGINSGLRISDLLGLTIGDVMDVNGKVRDRITIREQKTGKCKDFPISDSARKAISEYMRTHLNVSQSDVLFASRKGNKAISRQQAWKIINAAATTVGITDEIGTHTMRKTFGYHAYQSGVDISLIQKLLNHSAPSITLRYIGITQDQLDDVYLNLNL